MVAFAGRFHYLPHLACGALRMRRNAWSRLMLSLACPAFLPGQGFGIYEHNSCTMAGGGVAAAGPCPDGSAIFFNPAGLAGLSETHLAAGLTLIRANGGFTDDILQQRTDLDDPLIPVPSGFVTHAITPKVTLGVGLYVPYGLETKWPTAGFDGRFLGYNTKIQSIYVQPAVAYQVDPPPKVGLGVAYGHGSAALKQRVDLSEQLGTGQTFTFAALGIPTATHLADSHLTANGNRFAVNIGALLKVR